MRTSLVCRSGRVWRLPSRWVWANKPPTITRAVSTSAGSLQHPFKHTEKATNPDTESYHHRSPQSAKGNSAGRGGWRSGHRSAAAESVTPPRQKASLLWLLWPRGASLQRVKARSCAVLARRLPLLLLLPPAARHGVVRAQKAVERFLALVERPARVGAAGVVATVHIAAQLVASLLQLFQEVYLYIFSPRLRRLLRFALGVPFLVGTLFLLQMREWYFPEVGTGLDTSCVESLPLCHTVEEALTHAAVLQQRYRRLLQARRERGQSGSLGKEHGSSSRHASQHDTQLSGSSASAASATARAPSLLQPLTREEENELLGAIFVLIRSIETQIVGTAEERALITPRADVVTSPPPPPLLMSVPAQQSPSPSPPSPAAPQAAVVQAVESMPHVAAAAAGAEVEDTVTATPHIAVSVAAAADLSTPSSIPTANAAVPSATAPVPAVVISPAEYILRVIMSISIAEGWADITEHTRVLFQDLVRRKTPPAQSYIVQAVGELCSLSYELESGQVDAITLDQRKRIAAAIDAFRPEKSVEERCTIAHEITILPLPDFDHTTRCLGLIRKSPGRKPQLILCFVGSNSRRNWLTNFNYWPVPLPARYGVVGAPLPGSHGTRVAQPQVHRGFLGLVQTVPYREVAAEFDHVLLVGHSLGGALAQLAGLELAAERPSRRITVITMASPRVLAVDWRSRLRMAGRYAWQHRGSRGAAPATATAPPFGDAHERDSLAAMLTTPPNYRHFRGFLQPDVVPHLPPEFLHFTHSGQRIPLNTGCATSLSFMAWGMYSELYHSADLYRSVLKQPIVSQTHWYTGDAAEEDNLVDVEEYVHRLHV